MAVEDIKTIVLRYRDLSKKNTIDLHSKIIDKKHFVWWGWWAKPQEKIALESFKDLKEKSNDVNGLKIYLLDSGKIELREAKCVDIYFDNGSFTKTPQLNATPTYYNKTEFMIWFKFTTISEPLDNANDYINAYSYLKVDEHFASRISPFSAFENKRVYDLNELIEQQCTIWYLRDSDSNDENKRIVSYAPGVSGIEQSFSISNDNKVVWLSDLHFSDNHHAFRKTVGSNNNLFECLKSKLETLSIKKFSKILVTGDFTFSADEKEFKSAQEFISQLSSSYGIGASSFILCPGNHDMKYSNEAYLNDKDQVVLNYDIAKENYINFYEKVTETTVNTFLNTIQRFITDDGVAVEIITLNTCILQQDEAHFRGMGFAGNNQLRELSRNLKQTKNMNTVRILTMHHHLLPVLFSEQPTLNPMYSMLLDSEAISQFCIENEIKLVLHGHTHKDFYAESTRKIKCNKKTYYVVGLGSTGAISADLTDNTKNQFAIIEFGKNILKIKIHEMLPNGSDTNKNPIIEHEIPYGGIE